MPVTEPAAETFDAGADDWPDDDRNAGKAATPPSSRRSAPAAGRPKGASRYRNTPAAQTEAADCVIHVFDSDEGLGREIAFAVRDQLRKDGTFDRVLVTEDTDLTGDIVTVEEGIVSMSAIPGGFFQKASCTIMASAEITSAEGGKTQASATAQQAAGNLNHMLKANKKAVSMTIARETLKLATGYRRLRQEISGLAIASMIFGIIALAPFVGFVFAFLWLIPAIVVLVYNRGRSQKIGLIRIGIGAVFVVIGIVISIILINSKPRRGRRFSAAGPPAARVVGAELSHTTGCRHGNA